MIDARRIKSILVISLSNFGDVILTFPVIDILMNDFPQASLSVVVGPKGETVLCGHPRIKKLYTYHKRQGWAWTLRWFLNLRKDPFDLIVDLRHTAMPFFMPARYKTPLILRSRQDQHMSQKHLDRLKTIYSRAQRSVPPRSLHISSRDSAFVSTTLQTMSKDTPFIAVAPGAADVGKRWSLAGFARFCDQVMVRDHVGVVFIGDAGERPIVAEVMGMMTRPALDLSGRLTLPQVGALLQRAVLLVANDTAPMHLASYLNRPVLALFGPTDPRKYGPWGQTGCLIEHKDRCPACRGKAPGIRHSCMEAITQQDLLDAFEIRSGRVIFKKPLKAIRE